MAQTLVIIGDPIKCGQVSCVDDATVMLRQRDPDGAFSVVQYCDYHWLAFRRGYAPMIARDEVQAVEEAESIAGVKHE